MGSAHDTQSINEGMGFVLHDVARLLRWSFDRQSKNLGLTRAQWSVLAHLYRGDGMQQAALAQTLDVAPITLARQLDRLEADGWLIRRADPNDRRAKTIHLTEKAAPMKTKLKQLGAKVRQQALDGISEEEAAQFLSTLNRIRQNLVPQDGN